ncbi:MAG TPA: DUF3037 domain-containing protein [Cytophagales bacterium]|nr:DUF3037 domain-containing protein [Cytophagales bacterium]
MPEDKVTYEYAIVRLVPKVEREEFLNVGVLLFSKRKRYLGMRYHLDLQKVVAFAPDLEIEDIHNYLQAWEAVVQGGRQGGRIGQLDTAERFRWLSAARSTLLQCSPTHPGLCHDPEGVLERLFQEYVM